jgi:hypothetical protein
MEWEDMHKFYGSNGRESDLSFTLTAPSVSEHREPIHSSSNREQQHVVIATGCCCARSELMTEHTQAAEEYKIQASVACFFAGCNSSNLSCSEAAAAAGGSQAGPAAAAWVVLGSSILLMLINLRLKAR